jgi:heme exporter protein B
LSFWGAASAILRKDLRAEFRTKQVFNSALVFSLLVIVIFSLAFQPSADEATDLSGGLLWIAFAFAAVLALSRTFAREIPNDCMLGLQLAPISPAAVYLGKLLGNVIFLSLMELLLLPLFAIFYNLRLWERGGWLILILFLGSWGLAAVGTSFAAIATNVRLRELMLPVLLFPIEIPLLLSLVQATTDTIRGGDSMLDLAIWLRLAVGFDVIFTVLSLFLFEYLLEG